MLPDLYTYSVIIGGVYEAAPTPVVDGITLRYGADNGYDQPYPATLSFSTVGMPQTADGVYDLPTLMGEPVSVYREVDGNPRGQLLFRGYIDGIASTPITHDASEQLMQFSAVSFMANLAQAFVGADDWAAETEAERIERIWNDTQYIAWDYVSDGATWDDIEAFGYGTTWESFGSLPTPNLYMGDHATSPVYDLESRLAQEIDALSYLQELARTTSGFFTEGPQIAWYWSRLQLLGLTYTDFDLPSHALSVGMNTDLILANIYTNVTYANSSVSATYADGAGVAKYGVRPLTITTPIANTPDLIELTALKAAALSQLRAQMPSVLINYDTLDEADRIWSVDEPIAKHFTNVPAQYGGDADYLVRGVQIALSTKHCEATWILLPRQIVDQFTEWINVNPADIWDNYLTSTTTWSEVQ